MSKTMGQQCLRGSFFIVEFFNLSGLFLNLPEDLSETIFSNADVIRFLTVCFLNIDTEKNYPSQAG